MTKPYKIAVLISGTGSNLQSLIAAQADGGFEIAVVVSNKTTAGGLLFAEQANIPTVINTRSQYPEREHYDQALANSLALYPLDLIVLAGFMRILGPALVQQFTGKLINIHPSLLPAYPGLHTHQRALDAGDTWHGSTVHFVNSELDQGPMIAQAKLKIKPNDTPEQLANRVKLLEHQLYPAVVKLFAQGDIALRDQQVYYQGQALPHNCPIDPMANL